MLSYNYRGVIHIKNNLIGEIKFWNATMINKSQKCWPFYSIGIPFF